MSRYFATLPRSTKGFAAPCLSNSFSSFPRSNSLLPSGSGLLRESGVGAAALCGYHRHSQLLQHAQLIRTSPALDHLAVLELGYLQAADLYLSTRGGDAHQRTVLRSGDGVGERQGVVVANQGFRRNT